MAEGDSILRIARRLNGTVVGPKVGVRTPGRRRPDGLPVCELDSRRLERAESRGKHLLLRFEGGLVLHNHLGMRGSWHFHRQGESWRRPSREAWIAVRSNGLEAVNFGGSTMRIVTEAQLGRDPRLARLGPDLLADGFEPTAAIARMRGTNPRIELGEALLGQRLVAGIGNVFKSEGCFEAGVDPTLSLGSLEDERLADVLSATRRLMLEAVETGRQPKRVYGRAGQPCPRCGAKLRSRAQGDSARTTYWCADCQSD